MQGRPASTPRTSRALRRAAMETLETRRMLSAAPAAPIPGDANLDGVVNFADLQIVAQNMGHGANAAGNPVSWTDGDFDAANVVDFDDLILLAENCTTAPTPSQLAQLPTSVAADWNLAQIEAPFLPAALTANSSGDNSGAGDSNTTGDITNNSDNGNNSDNSGNTSGSSQTSGGSQDTGGSSNPTPDPNVLQAVITPVSATNIFVGQAFQAQALNSTLATDTPLTATYQWNFGDTSASSSYNQLNGWNAAHVYNSPGIYTVTLTVTAASGQSSTASTQVDVSLPRSMRTIYVSTTGNDANNGLSTATPIQSVAQAQAMLGNNTQVLFEDGDTFPMSAGLYSIFDNVMFGSYAGANGASDQPILYWTGGPANYSMISDAATSTGLTVNGLTFDSVYGADSTQTPPDAISPQGTDITITNNTFLNLSYDVNLNAAPDGVMMENNTSPTTTGLRGYFVWAQGSDLTILGNTAVNSTTQHIVRVGGAERMLIAYNNFANVNVYSKDTITVQIGEYAYIAHNTLLQGSTNIGPTDASGLVTDPAQQAASFFWAVVEDNTLYVPLTIQAGASEVAVRGNVAFTDNSTAFIIQGFNAAYNRGVSNVSISGNTEINSGTSGSFVTLLGAATGISLTDNLYVAPNLVFGNVGDTIGTPVQVQQSDLSSFSQISQNVWPAYFDSGPAKGGEMFIAPLGSSFYATPDQWNAYPQVSGDDFEAVALPADYLADLAAFSADGVQLFASGD